MASPCSRADPGHTLERSFRRTSHARLPDALGLDDSLLDSPLEDLGLE